MKIVEHYRRRAAECENLAAEAISQVQRQSIPKIALSWRELADQRERMLNDWSGFQRPKPVYPPELTPALAGFNRARWRSVISVRSASRHRSRSRGSAPMTRALPIGGGMFGRCWPPHHRMTRLSR